MRRPSVRRRARRRAAAPARAGVLLLALAACADAQAPAAPAPLPLPLDGAAYWPGAAWRRAEPAQVAMRAAPMAELRRRIRADLLPGLHAMVVVRHGYVVLEEYRNGSHAGDVHTMQSVSKSVTSLVVGTAHDAGLLRLDAPVLGFFDYAGLQHLDDRKRAVTVEHLLTMRSGIDFHEAPYAGSPLQQLNDSRGDWVRLVLDRPMNDAPDGHWQYNSGGVIVLAGVLRAATGESPASYARRALFAPIGVASDRWAQSPYDGLPHTGGGLALTAADLARVGYLVLRDGQWEGRPVVSRDWLARTLAPTTPRPRSFGRHPVDYGHLWWLLPLDGAGGTARREDAIVTASGAGGQWLFVVPRHDLVVAVTASTQGGFVTPIDWLYELVLAAVR